MKGSLEPVALGLGMEPCSPVSGPVVMCLDLYSGISGVLGILSFWGGCVKLSDVL